MALRQKTLMGMVVASVVALVASEVAGVWVPVPALAIAECWPVLVGLCRDVAAAKNNGSDKALMKNKLKSLGRHLTSLTQSILVRLMHASSRLLCGHWVSR